MRRYEFNWRVEKHYLWYIKGVEGHSVFTANNLEEAFKFLKENIIETGHYFRNVPVMILSMKDSD